LLGECLNIGVLVYFAHDKRFVFEFSKNLSRIKSVYSNVSEKTLKHFLRQIQLKINKINKKNDSFIHNEIESSFDEFVKEYILPIDGSALQFVKSTENYQYGKSNLAVLNYLNDLFLFELTKHGENKEYLLGKKFYDFVSPHVNEVGKSNNPNFYKDFPITNTTGVEYKFRFAWLNGSTNLVKPLNFDLKQPISIEKKAHENYGLFVDLRDVAKDKNLEYHLIVGRPTKKLLFKQYDHSLKILGDLPETKIIEEGDLKSYSNKLISTIRK